MCKTCTKLLQDSGLMLLLLHSCSPHVCSLKKSLPAASTRRAGTQRVICQHLPVLSLFLKSPLLLSVGLQTLTLGGRLMLRSYFLSNKVKGERLVLISMLTRAPLWPLLLEALHLSHTDLSSLVPFFCKQWHWDLLRKNCNDFSCLPYKK